MKITKYIHSCLLIEHENDKILFDPGHFSFVEGKVKPSQFKDITAILLTHCHPDHIDDDALAEIIENNPGVQLLANSEITGKLEKKDITAEIFEHGKRIVGSFEIEAFDAPHEAILADEIPQNTAYVINGSILHPGDSLSKNLYHLKGMEVVCLPMTAPWETELQTFDFAKQLAPKRIVPIHDGYVKDFFLHSRYLAFQNFLRRENIIFHWMNKEGDYAEY